MAEINKKNALISVSNKKGIADFAARVHKLGITIYSTGNTAKSIRESGIPVIDVAEITGGGEILDGRVKTLSREIATALLADPNKQEHMDELQRLGIPFIDLVCVDFYPLRKEIEDPNHTIESVIEQTDIGGPTMVREAAKGRRIVICDLADREEVIEALEKDGDIPTEKRRELAGKAEFIVSEYGRESAKYLSKGKYDGFTGEQIRQLAKGENSPQSPAFLYSTNTSDPLALCNFELVGGSGTGYVNECDIDRLLQTITHIAAAWDLNCGKVPDIALGCKHGNTTGAAVALPYLNAREKIVEKMVLGDPRAIFGGLVMFNFPINKKMAEIIATCGVSKGKRILDGVIAPIFDPTAIDVLKRKNERCRFIQNKALSNLSMESLDKAPRFRYVRGGFLKQPNYLFIPDFNSPSLKIHGPRRKDKEDALLLAGTICTTSNSNTITICNSENGVAEQDGNGVNRQDRVGSAELAVKISVDAGHDLNDAVAWSDSFFPFADGPKVLIEAGIRTIFSTTGSVKDEEIRDFILKNGATLYQMPDEDARGFCVH